MTRDPSLPPADDGTVSRRDVLLTTLATAGTAALAGGDDKAAPKSAPPHPLDPLSAAELTAAVQLLRKERKLAASYRFVSCTLDEPARKTVRESRSVPRRAFVVLL